MQFGCKGTNKKRKKQAIVQQKEIQASDKLFLIITYYDFLKKG
jgi:hypothetical protein